MKKMKKWLALGLAAAMSMMVLTACGSEEATEEEKPVVEEAAEKTAEPEETAVYPEDVQAIVDRGVLKVGVKNAVQGFGFQDPLTNEYSGMEISLAKMMPQATVTAWDVSPQAIETAKGNNVVNETEVTFVEQDIFAENVGSGKFDIIVSNPPYIKENEKENMLPNVLDWEPEIALFVPDNDPLLFYRQIARKGLQLLNPGGKLYFEINREHGEETCAMLAEYGYKAIELRKDFAENDRMIRAILESPTTDTQA